MSKSYYKHGDWNAECDVCGFEFKASQLRSRWDGLMVCRADYEPRHPSDFFRVRPEDTSVPWARPDKPEAAGTDIEGNATSPAINTDTQTTIPDGTNDGSL
jgi:hypothetical protein